VSGDRAVSSWQATEQTLLHPFKAGQPFEAVAVDITGKNPKSASGNEYVVTATCLFSRSAEAFPVRNHTAPTVARVLVEQRFTRFGVPKRILTDLGAEFQGQLFTEMCKRFEVDQVRATAYEPRTNEQVERFHRTLKHYASVDFSASGPQEPNSHARRPPCLE